MSNIDAPDVGSGETNIPDLLSEQSGMPNMSSTKTFTVDTNMQVNGDLGVTGTVTATSFIGDGSQLTGISGGSGGGLDSAAVTLLVDSDYVQARVTLDGVGLDSAGVTALVDSDYVAARAPAGGETYSIDETGRANTDDWIRFDANGANTQDQVFLKSANTAETWRGSTGYGGFQFDGNATSQAFVMQNGDNGAHLIGYRYVTGGDEGLVLEGKSGQASKSTIYLDTNSKTAIKITDGSVELPNIPTTDPNNTNEIWSDNGVLVMSGSTAPTGGGGLDSAGVQSVLGGLESIIIGLGASEGVTSASGAQIAIGEGAAAVQNSIALGANAYAYQNGVAIGHGSHQGSNGHRAVVIGSGAGSVNTGFDAVAIGYQAGGGAASGSYPSQRHRNVYIGGDAGASYPALYGVAIGWEAGKTNHGTSSIAIGAMAGRTGQGDNNIIMNATGATLDRTDNFGIDIRTSAAGSLTYDTTNDWTFGAGVTMTDLTASGATVVFSNLPTTDPVNAGQLWNDGGTLKVSAG